MTLTLDTAARAGQLAVLINNFRSLATDLQAKITASVQVASITLEFPDGSKFETPPLALTQAESAQIITSLRNLINNKAAAANTELQSL